MAKLTHLGFGYELWANIAKDELKKLDNILNIMEDVEIPEKIKKYFDPTWDEQKSLPIIIATSNGPFGTMTIVHSDNYPVAAHAIKLIPTHSTSCHESSGFPSWKCYAPAARQD
jgi:hypothetical protein